MFYPTNLGKDAASLYNPEQTVKDWVSPLQQAYADAPGRLHLHALALNVQAIPKLKARLQFSQIGGLDDDSGMRLRRALGPLKWRKTPFYGVGIMIQRNRLGRSP